MPHRQQPFDRDQYEAVLDQLTAAGWISEWGHKGDAYVLKWTAKGLERSKWVKEIATGLELGPQGMTALLVICHLHAENE